MLNTIVHCWSHSIPMHHCSSNNWKSNDFFMDRNVACTFFANFILSLIKIEPIKMVSLNGQNKVFTKFTHFSKQSFFQLKLKLQLKLIFCCRIMLPIGKRERGKCWCNRTARKSSQINWIGLHGSVMHWKVKRFDGYIGIASCNAKIDGCTPAPTHVDWYSRW